MKYKFICKGDRQEFEDEINLLIEQGYSIGGNHCSSYFLNNEGTWVYVFSQLMKKENKEEVNPRNNQTLQTKYNKTELLDVKIVAEDGSVSYEKMTYAEFLQRTELKQIKI